MTLSTTAQTYAHWLQEHARDFPRYLAGDRGAWTAKDARGFARARDAYLTAVSDPAVVAELAGQMVMEGEG